MKKADNNEMDLALHSLAKRGESSLFANSSAWGQKNGPTEHLDADELNSYAEGLVPEPARARYTEHLADCAGCRSVVVGLTQALGPAPLASGTAAEPGSGFWGKLSALLSMPVLRFGVPAFALTVMIAVGFLAWRRERRPDFVAQNQPSAAAEPVPNNKDSTAAAKEQPSVNPGAGLTSVPTPNAPAPLAPSTDTVAALVQPKAEQTTPDSVSSVKPFLKNSAEPPPPPAPAEAASKTAGLDTFPERKIGSLAAKPTSTDEVQKSADKKQEVNESVAQTRARDESNFQKDAEREDDNRAYSANAPSGPRRVEGLAGARGGYGRKNKRDTTDDDETRSVVGRSFRRQGSLWIDTAYSSSQMTINVRRGSEQFRALVADEPAIRDVANSLSGEIILVWKGKAYRIR